MKFIDRRSLATLFLLAPLLLFIHAPFSRAAGKPSTGTQPIVLVFGDSLAAAYGLQQDAGWVHLLGERLARHSPPYRLVNASISGETTRGGLARLDAVLAQYHPAVVIIELGGNDGLRGLPLKATRDNLSALVKNARQAKAKVLLVGVELPPNYGPAYTQQFKDNYSVVAKQQNIALVPSLLAGFAEKRELFQPDGIHPAASAQPMILDTIWKQLAPLLDAGQSIVDRTNARVGTPGRLTPIPSAHTRHAA
jgi:acyl-CoA thioesterase-1